MAAMADKIISGSVTGISPSTIPGPPIVCNTADPTNWGDPLNPGSPCGSFFPVIYAPGDVTLSGPWSGQGTLLVQGDLTITGTVNFYGAVMVKGSVQAADGRIVGALTLNSSTGTANQIAGTATVTYSRCALDRAEAGVGRLLALQERSWLQLY
jgi:hypothetical protein